jgi:hypothetical protein
MINYECAIKLTGNTSALYDVTSYVTHAIRWYIGYFSNLFDNENKQTANRQIHLYLVTGVSEISAISLFNTAKK